MSKPEELLAWQLKASGISFKREFRPWKDRRFRFDFKLDNKVLVEVQGGIWIKGAHSSGIGISRDAEKSCLAAADGYRVMPVTPAMIKKGTALLLIVKASCGE